MSALNMSIPIMALPLYPSKRAIPSSSKDLDVGGKRKHYNKLIVIRNVMHVLISNIDFMCVQPYTKRNKFKE